MRINELQIKQDLQNSALPEKILAKYGWKVLGHGIEGAVAEHPYKSYVLKIFDSHSDYRKYVDLSITSMRGNPHVPVFYSSRYAADLKEDIGERVKILVDIPGTAYSYVRMEKLTSITNTELLRRFRPELITAYLIELQYGKRLLGDELSTAIRQRLIWLLGNKGTPAANNEQLSQLVSNTELLDKVWQKMGPEPDVEWKNLLLAIKGVSSRSRKFDIDLHDENVMLRGPTLVITDPLY